jgi:hypothetical protein
MYTGYSAAPDWRVPEPHRRLISESRSFNVADKYPAKTTSVSVNINSGIASPTWDSSIERSLETGLNLSQLFLEDTLVNMDEGDMSITSFGAEDYLLSNPHSNMKLKLNRSKQLQRATVVYL